jgi:hypothetical protein
MSNPFRVLRPVFLVAVAAMAAACASTAGSPPSRFGPGETVEFNGTAYQMILVDQEFVLMRQRDSVGEAGGISGFVDEVFSVPRYRLGEGRWTNPTKAPGVALQWLGFENFALTRDDDVATAAAAPAAGEVVLAQPEAAGK